MLSMTRFIRNAYLLINTFCIVYFIHVQSTQSEILLYTKDLSQVKTLVSRITTNSKLHK